LRELSEVIREVRARRLEEALRMMKAYLAKLSRHIEVREAYLFGSIARGDSLDVSDIDLLVVSPSVHGLRKDERISLAHRAWRFEKAADIFLLTPEEFKRALEHSVVLRDASRYWIKIL